MPLLPARLRKAASFENRVPVSDSSKCSGRKQPVSKEAEPEPSSPVTTTCESEMRAGIPILITAPSQESWGLAKMGWRRSGAKNTSGKERKGKARPKDASRPRVQAGHDHLKVSGGLGGVCMAKFGSACSHFGKQRHTGILHWLCEVGLWPPVSVAIRDTNPSDN
ncbi:hypothetical protein DUI87_16699 [Hirundo rustica rustica]|uniref:Uncharacterized protein n=1 Tax=Hirundo rustica rustica TaxID=333673 RepID=A0A3M0K1Y0_HIRRU|nr:hypothetical protein DUI87_16699 [Hirundo rustica rustica]